MRKVRRSSLLFKVYTHQLPHEDNSIGLPNLHLELSFIQHHVLPRRVFIQQPVLPLEVAVLQATAYCAAYM
jgi:hypothetical protein